MGGQLDRRLSSEVKTKIEKKNEPKYFDQIYCNKIYFTDKIKMLL